MKRFCFGCIGAVLLFAGGARAAETGDVDGDGRLTIADARHAAIGLAPAAGSVDAILQGDPCGTTLYRNLEGIIYTETLSRGVEGSLPHWALPFSALDRAPPLPEDARVGIRIEDVSAPGGDNDQAELLVTLVSFVPIVAFSLVLDSDGGILRVPFREKSWYRNDWDQGFHSSGFRHDRGDLDVDVFIPPHFITRGKYVASYGVLFTRRDVIAPGEHSIVLGVRLPRGTLAGDYAVRLLAASEVLLESGEIVSPAVEYDGVLKVERTVTTGWDEGPPPLRVDPVEQRILGKIEFRATEAAGFPGDEVHVRVQMRTEVPLNWIGYQLFWPDARLTCLNGPDNVPSVFVNPEDGSPYRGERSFCSDQGTWGRYFHEAIFYLTGDNMNESSGYLDRPLDYFKPLGKWVDVTDLALRISPNVAGGTEIPLVFQPFDPNEVFFQLPSPAQFVPYASVHNCRETTFDGPGRLRWHYDVEYHSSRVRVLGDGEPVDPIPIDAGIVLELGSGSGAPGGLVEIPLFARTREPLFSLQAALEMNAELIDVEAIDMELLRFKSFETERHVLARGQSVIIEDCDENGRPGANCTYGAPWVSTFRPTSPGTVLLHLLIPPPLGETVEYPGPDAREIGKLRVRLKDSPPGTEAAIRFGKVKLGAGLFDPALESGGELFVQPENASRFAPATNVRNGAITFLESRFLRGDSNGDGRVDLSDAVATLGHLFLGVESVSCLEAADADDSGGVLITDAILVLGVLFLGEGVLPPPFPSCGIEAGVARLECQKGCP